MQDVILLLEEKMSELISNDLKLALNMYFSDVLYLSYDENLSNELNASIVLERALDEDFSFETKLIIKRLIMEMK